MKHKYDTVVFITFGSFFLAMDSSEIKGLPWEHISE